MKNAEAKIQADVVRWIRAAAPDTVLFAVLNDGLFTKAEASKRRWMGLLAGIPDVILVTPGGRCFGIEVKTISGRLSPDQREIHERMAALGIPVAVVRSLTEARAALVAWGITHNESEPPEGLPAARACGAPARRVFTHTATTPRPEISEADPARA